MMRGAIAAVMVWAMPGGHSATAEESARSEVPAAFAPFEHMIGGWKGMGIPAANRLKGWPETHQWAWKFTGGNPVAMTVTTEGGKVLKQGQLSFDAASRRYRLEGTDPAGKPVAFVGELDPAGQALTLDRLGSQASGKDRLIIRPNRNRIRYSMWIDHQEPGAPQFKRTIEVGLTKEGEAFAAGGSASDLPKCIITGGASTMTVSYQGKSYPLCCSGCRDEFNDNPAKYVQKALSRARDGGENAATKPASASVGKDDDSFDGLVDDPPTQARPPRIPSPPRAKAKADRPDPAPLSVPKPGKDAARAASLLRLGQNLDKQGKAAPPDRTTAGRRRYADTPEARTAAAASVKSVTANRGGGWARP
ncbi:MAG: YHS domain-containing protein [Singulisphaera sp.]